MKSGFLSNAAIKTNHKDFYKAKLSMPCLIRIVAQDF